jgi:hypothetical protein
MMVSKLVVYSLTYVFLKASSFLPFCLANTLGGFHWHQFWSQLLYPHGTNSNPKTELFTREGAGIPFDEPPVHVVANTRWLGSVAGQRYRRPMAVMATRVEEASKNGAACRLDSEDANTARSILR